MGLKLKVWNQAPGRKPEAQEHDVISSDEANLDVTSLRR